MGTNTKKFHIGDVLSITTKRLVSPRQIEGIYDILNFMTQDSLFTHQLPRAADECRPDLLRQFPQLDTAEMQVAIGELLLTLETPTGNSNPKESVSEWLSKLTSGQYGIQIDEVLDVQPLPNGAHTSMNPLQELADMGGKVRVVVVKSDV